jgi:protein-disulfide isomerase
MEPLVNKYVNSGRVSYEFRSFIIHGAIDVILTQLAHCADQSAFFPLVEQIYATQEQWITQAEAAGDKAQAAANLPPDQRMTGMADAYGLTDWFAARGVSKDQAHACLAKTDELQKIAEQTQKWSTDDGINQTPTIFINGAKTDIATWKDLEPALQNAGAR